MNPSTKIGALPPVLVLASGGLDSTTALCHFVKLNYATSALFVDFGQVPEPLERQAARAVAEYYGVRLDIVEVGGLGPFERGITVGRNLFLIATAGMVLKTGPALIAIGVHGGTDYPDCSPEFLSAGQAALDFYEFGSLRITAPFSAWSKGDIFRYAVEMEVPIDLTYSCDTGQLGGCGTCRSCLDLEALGVGS